MNRFPGNGSSPPAGAKTQDGKTGVGRGRGEEQPASIRVQCPNADCGKTYSVPSHFAGKKGKCADCGTTVSIPPASVKHAAATATRSTGRAQANDSGRQ